MSDVIPRSRRRRGILPAGHAARSFASLRMTVLCALTGVMLAGCGGAAAPSTSLSSAASAKAPASASAAASAAARPVHIAYATQSAPSLPIFVARDSRIFKWHGIEADSTYSRDGGTPIAALVGCDGQFIVVRD